jgi:hypothetical protein
MLRGESAESSEGIGTTSTFDSLGWKSALSASPFDRGSSDSSFAARSVKLFPLTSSYSRGQPRGASNHFSGSASMEHCFSTKGQR